MANDYLRIVLDTNLWISFLITKNYAKLDSLLASGKITLLFSHELLSEFLEVTSRSKFRKYFAVEEVTHLITTIEKYIDTIRISTEVAVCRDEKDNFLLALAIDGNADYLITGDNDLLILKTQAKTKILTMSDFLKEFNP